MTQLELEMHVLPNHEFSELEIYRRKILCLEQEIDMLKEQIAQENKAKYEAWTKIAELTTGKIIDALPKVQQ